MYICDIHIYYIFTICVICVHIIYCILHISYMFIFKKTFSNFNPNNFLDTQPSKQNMHDIIAFYLNLFTMNET